MSEWFCGQEQKNDQSGVGAAAVVVKRAQCRPSTRAVAGLARSVQLDRFVSLANIAPSFLTRATGCSAADCPRFAETDSCPSDNKRIKCLGFGVRDIDLSQLKLTGSISTTLCQMSRLELLDLQGNPGLVGTVPTEIGTCSSLDALVLAGCGLEGALPSSIGSLASLRSLRLNDNRFGSTLPSELSLLDLRELHLGNNSFFGAVPSLTAMARLTSLSIENNRFSGNVIGIPRGIDVCVLQNASASDNCLDCPTGVPTCDCSAPSINCPTLTPTVGLTTHAVTTPTSSPISVQQPLTSNATPAPAESTSSASSTGTSTSGFTLTVLASTTAPLSSAPLTLASAVRSAPSGGSDSTDVTVIIVVIVGAVLLLLVLAVAVMLARRRRKAKDDTSNRADEATTSGTPTHDQNYAKINVNLPPSEYTVMASSRSMPSSTDDATNSSRPQESAQILAHVVYASTNDTLTH